MDSHLLLHRQRQWLSAAIAIIPIRLVRLSKTLLNSHKNSNHGLDFFYKYFLNCPIIFTFYKNHKSYHLSLLKSSKCLHCFKYDIWVFQTTFCFMLVWCMFTHKQVEHKYKYHQIFRDLTDMHALDEIYTKYTWIDAKGAGNPMGLWAPYLLHSDFFHLRGASRHRLQSKPLVSDPSMYHGTCVTIAAGGGRKKCSRRMRNQQFYVSGKRPMAWMSNYTHRKLCYVIICYKLIWIMLLNETPKHIILWKPLSEFTGD